ncbi:hypothetical protein BKA70DRAFT_75098 [Coprinopsis sp. MPI-PUGE-AT-0042]|nr:hypothetical protein BKA70DRAFT_75098 [Coprinopsis sp. MPI-PUGE-AT-0042]
MQICFNVATLAAQDVTMTDIAPGAVWSPTSVVRIASRQLSSWLSRPSTLHLAFPRSGRLMDIQQPSSMTSPTDVAFKLAGREMATVHSLPTELLDMVFDHYTHTISDLPYDASHLDAMRMSVGDPFRQCVGVTPNATTNPVVLTHVCARWRSLAISTPKLWAKISVRWPKPRNVPMLATWLQRSAQRPLDLQLTQHSADVNSRNTSAIRDIFYLLLANSHRWRRLSLRLYADTGPLFRAIYEHQHWASSSVLEEVSLHLLEDWTPAESGMLCSHLYGSSKLKKLTLGDFLEVPNALWAAPFSRVTDINIAQIPLHQLFTLISLAEALENLSVWDVEEALGRYLPQDTLTVPRLKTLKLSHINDDGTKFFGRVTLPAIRTLKLPMGMGILSEPCEAWASLSSCLSRSACSLATFEMEVPDDQEDLLLEMLSSSHLSEVADLSIQSDVSDRTLDALTITSSSSILPQLAQLRLRRCRGQDGALSRMITSRAKKLRYVQAVLNEALRGDVSFYSPDTILDFQITREDEQCICGNF